MNGLKGEDGRWIQDEGEIDIQCVAAPIVILETPLLVVTVAFYTNNEPHLNFTALKESSIEVMKYSKRALVDVLVKFDELGYDRVFILVPENDQVTIRKVDWLGFVPKIIYDSPLGIRFIKYEMETR